MKSPKGHTNRYNLSYFEKENEGGGHFFYVCELPKDHTTNNNEFTSYKKEKKRKKSKAEYGKG